MIDDIHASHLAPEVKLWLIVCQQVEKIGLKSKVLRKRRDVCQSRVDVVRPLRRPGGSEAQCGTMSSPIRAAHLHACRDSWCALSMLARRRESLMSTAMTSFGNELGQQAGYWA